MNTRYIDIDTEEEIIRVGYNYVLSKFYVTNKETTTYRITAEEILEVLDSLNITSVTLEELNYLKDNIETLSKIYYKWEETGYYIKAVQFNDFTDYQLIIDCSISKIYIQNSTIIFDLLANESVKEVRVPILVTFMKDTLGLEVPREVMLAIYNMLTSYYSPTCVNLIQEREHKEDTLRYGNLLKLTNYNNEAISTYNCISNPYNEISPTIIGNILSMSVTGNYITLEEPISEEIINKYDIEPNFTKIIVSGTTIDIDGTEYTNDNTYTIKAIDNNIITLEEAIPTNYMYNYYICNVQAYTYTVSSMKRDTYTINLTSTPTDILIGDTIHITDAMVHTTYEDISCNGMYTVNSIQGNSITVEEPIPTDFSGSATLSKEIFIGNIESIEGNNIVLTADPIQNNLVSSRIMVYNNDIQVGSTIVTAQSDRTLTTENILEPYEIELPHILYPEPKKDIMIDVTYTNKEYEDKFPTGQFILNEFSQLQRYVNTMNGLIPVPTNVTGSLLNKKVPLTKIIEVKDWRGTSYIPPQFITLYCIGVYEEDKKE